MLIFLPRKLCSTKQPTKMMKRSKVLAASFAMAIAITLGSCAGNAEKKNNEVETHDCEQAVKDSCQTAAADTCQTAAKMDEE